MYIVQKRESEASHWHTCSYNGRKCRYEDIAGARSAFRRQKALPENESHPNRQYRILDTNTNEEVK